MISDYERLDSVENYDLIMIFKTMMIGIYVLVRGHDKIANALSIFNLITNLQVDFPASPVSLFLLGPLLGEICFNINILRKKLDFQLLLIQFLIM